MNNKIEYTFLSSGDAFSLRNSLIPFVCDVEQDLPVKNLDELDEVYSIGDIFKIKSGPTADAGFLTTIAVGVVVFVGGWAGKKLLDEVYEEKLRPRIKSWLEKLDGGLASNSKESPKQLQIGIWYEDRKVLVLVVIEADSYKDMIDSEPLVSAAHENAINWIEKNGVLSPIHVHIIRGSDVNIEPMTFGSIEEYSLKNRRKRTLTISSSRPSLRSGD